MRSTKTFSIRFWADTQNAQNDQALIYLRLTVNQKRNLTKKNVWIGDDEGNKWISTFRQKKK